MFGVALRQAPLDPSLPVRPSIHPSPDTGGATTAVTLGSHIGFTYRWCLHLGSWCYDPTVELFQASALSWG